MGLWSPNMASIFSPQKSLCPISHFNCFSKTERINAWPKNNNSESPSGECSPPKNHSWGTDGSNLTKLLLGQTKEKKKPRASETCVEHGMAKPLVSDQETRGEDREKREKKF